jgi:bifunctional non-homologous end joining protein LigD
LTVVVRGEVVHIGRHDVKITHPEKILFPEDGITKQDLIEYYRRIASWILPHLRGRPLAMERYPDGIDKSGFFQQTTACYYPGWIKTVTVKKVGGTVKHVVCDDAATLVYLANQACVTPHIWLSRADKLDYPNQMVFDLDPAIDSFEPVKATAQSLKALLDQLGLPAYLKTTGSRGLHVAVPLRRSEGFEAVRAFARELARIVVSQEPEQRTLEPGNTGAAAACSWTRTATPTHKRWRLLTPCGLAVGLRARCRSTGTSLAERIFGPMG